MDEALLEKVIKESYICARCGYCCAVCPTYNFNDDKWESLSPRGKLTALRKGLKEKNYDKFLDKLFQCTLCGACKEVCQTDIDLQHLWIELRKEASALQKIPETLKKLNSLIVKNHNITDFSNDERLDWAKPLERAKKLSQNLVKEKADVCYFVGCVSSLFPASNAIPRSFVQILDKAKVNFTVLAGNEWCCGFPQLASGFAQDAREQIRHNVMAINNTGAKIVVTTCPGCYRIFKEEYREILQNKIDLNFEVLHATEFIDLLITENKISLIGTKLKDTVVTYHDPCDLGRNSKIYEPPRRIIKAIPNISFKELANIREDAVCCGGGGDLAFFNPKLVEEISGQKISEIKETKATIVVSACQACISNIRDRARKANESLRVIDISELVLMAMD